MLFRSRVISQRFTAISILKWFSSIYSLFCDLAHSQTISEVCFVFLNKTLNPCQWFLVPIAFSIGHPWQQISNFWCIQAWLNSSTLFELAFTEGSWSDMVFECSQTSTSSDSSHGSESGSHDYFVPDLETISMAESLPSSDAPPWSKSTESSHHPFQDMWGQVFGTFGVHVTFVCLQLGFS